MRRCSRSVAESLSPCEVSCGSVSDTFWLSGVLVQPASSKASVIAATRVLQADPGAALFKITLFVWRMIFSENRYPLFRVMRYSTNSICPGASAMMIGPPRCSIHQRTRMRRPSSCFGSTPATANVRCWRLRMITVKPRIHRRQKLTYIVAPLSRTDKTLPSTSAKCPCSVVNRARFSASKAAKFGSAQSPRRAFGS